MGINNMAMIILIGGAVLIGATFLLTPKKDDDKEKDGNGAPPKTMPVLTGQEKTFTTTQGTRSTSAARPDIDMDSEPHMESVQAL
jgi:hypothetical protein